MKGLAGAAIVMITGASAWAQEPARDVIQLTAAEAVERARAASPSLAQFRALSAAARADVQGARAARLPQLEAAAGYTRQSDVPELTLTLPGQPPRTLFPNIPDNYRTRLSAAVPVYTGGRLEALAEATRHEVEAAEGDVHTAAAELVFETTSAYWSLVVARETERVLGLGRAAFDAHAEDAKNRERFGLAAHNEVLAVQVERDRADLARIRASHAADVAEANLQRLLGLPSGTRIEASEALGTVADEPTALEPMITAALAQRSERAALAARVAAADTRARVENAARRPQVTAGAGLDYANPNRRILPPEARWQGSWDVSLNVSWMLFDGGRARAGAQRAQARAEALRVQLEDLDGRIRLEVTRAHLERAAARRGIEVAEGGQAAARENLRVVTERHRAGVATAAERLDAERALLGATLDYTEAVAGLRIATAALFRALGR